MGSIDATIRINTTKSAGIVTIVIINKPFRIRTYERGFKKMITFDFNPRSCRTYDDRARNHRICNTYEKHGGWGDLAMGNLRKCFKGSGP